MNHKNHEHVQYILLAEFDIDKGASLKYQYPAETGTDEHMLSELMLPDGAHMREEDWTIFCLNQKIPDLENADGARESYDKPLLYVLNLVRTKHDATARRGARVRAMAICTRHQFLHIYKPILLLAMEKYFETPSKDILATLYRTVNSMDLSCMPSLSWHQRQILRSSDDKSMFEEMFVDDGPAEKPLPQLHTNRQPYSVQPRSPHQGTYIDLASGQKVLASANRDRHYFDTHIEYDGIKLPIRIPLTANADEVGDFSLIKLVNTFAPPSNSPGSPNPHHPHLDSSGPYTHPFIILINALLTQKRIIFLGYGLPSGEVANYVLAACALGSGCGTMLRGFTERAFPYTNLAGVDDLLKCPGFIAGVTNPTFEEHTAWWDVLCNISTGKITVSKDIDPPARVGRKLSLATLEESVASLSIHRSSSSSMSNQISRAEEKMARDRDPDAEFMAEVQAAIQAHYGEISIRARFQDYVQRFVRLGVLYEYQTYQRSISNWYNQDKRNPNDLLGYGSVFPDEASKRRTLNAYANRLEGWLETISYKYLEKDLDIWESLTTLPGVDVYRHLTRLRTFRNIPETQVVAIYEVFHSCVQTDDQIMEFLSHFPQHQGGLIPLAHGFFHASSRVREFTFNIFRRLGIDKTGAKFIRAMPRFYKETFERLISANPNAGCASPTVTAA